jgi:hypothetical protein
MDTSEGGFLYARSFTVAMGQEFHDCVAGDLEMGAPWADCEEIRYSFAHLHHERFGAFPGTGSGISRERSSRYCRS